MQTTQTTTASPKIKAPGQPAVIIAGRLFSRITEAEFRARLTGQTRVAYSARLLARALHSKTLAPRLLKLGNYFDLTNGNRITYCPRGRTQEINPETGKWRTEGRQEIKPGRFAALLRMERHAENVANLFPAVEVKEAATVEDFARVYNDDHHFTSCMTGQGLYVARYYVSFGCVLLYTEDSDGHPTSRAILWPAVNFDGETRAYLDRKYGNHDKRAALAAYAMEKHNAYVKETDVAIEHSAGEGLDILTPDGGNECYTDVTVIPPTNHQPAGNLPYLDTFYADDIYDTPNLDANRNKVQTVDGDWIDEDEAVWSDSEDGYLRSSDAVQSDVTQRWYRDSDDDLRTIRYRGYRITFHLDETE